MSPRLRRILQIIHLILPLLFFVLFVRGCNGGDYLIIDTPSRSHTLYIEEAKLSYFTTPQSADGSWRLRIDHAGPRSVPRRYDDVLGFRFHRNATDLLISIPLLVLFLVTMPAGLYVLLSRPHPDLLGTIGIAFGLWPVLLGLVFFKLPEAASIFVTAACVAIPLLLTRDMIRRAVGLRLAPWPWQFNELKQYRRAHAGLCAICGYDVRASPQTCPECGTPIQVTIAAKRGLR